MRVRLLTELWGLIVAAVLLGACNRSENGAGATADPDSLLREGVSLAREQQYEASLERLMDVVHNSDTTTAEGRRRLIEANIEIGNISNAFEDVPEALSRYREALSLMRRGETPDSLAERICSNISQTFARKGQPDSALVYASMIPDPTGYSYLFCRAYIAYYSGDYSRSADWLSKAVKQARSPHEFAYAYSLSAFCRERTGDIAGAEADLLDFERSAREARNNYALFNCYTYQMRFYTRHRRTDKALDYQAKFLTLHDSLFNTNAYFGQLDKHRSFEKQQKAVEIAEMKASLASQRLMIGLSAAVALVLGGALLFMWWRWKLLKERNAILYERNVELARADALLSSQAPVSAPELNDGSDEALLDKIREVMTDPRVYCNPDFNLASLAEMVGSNTSYVSRSINQLTGKNFRTFINEYRIRRARMLMVDDKKYASLTLRAIAEDVGIKSPANFIAAFKKVTGMTPSAFMKLQSENA